MEYNISKKVGDKWFTYGKIKMNKWNNPECSFKNTPEVRELFTQDGAEWVNFSLFVPKPKVDAPVPKASIDDAPPF